MAKRTTKAADRRVASIKGFNTDMTCRDHKFVEGGTYSVKGKIEVCENGFHACSEHPLDVFLSYPPASSVYHDVVQSGALDESCLPQKLASATITIGARVQLRDLTARAVKFVFDHAKPSKGSTSDEGSGAASSTGDQGAAGSTGVHGAASSTGYQGAASSTGDYGAASSTGDCGAASSTGDCGAASSTGYRGAASSTGDYGAASSTGDYGVASSTGAHAVALAIGSSGRARAGKTGAICLVCRDPMGGIVAIRASKVGENGVKPNVFYRLGPDGEFVECV